jgi:predicted nucleotidyltransferase component of viral defense system
MSIFEKWAWIKRNWPYIIEEATKLGLVFVGGTALNLIIFDEYRASEDIDLYDPDADSVGTKHEQDCVEQLATRLDEKGYDVKSLDGRSFLIGPNIKVEVFNDGTHYKKIEKRRLEQVEVLTFDPKAYAQMKLTALLCRTSYDARDLVDLFKIKKEGGIEPSFPDIDCEIIEKNFSERLSDIRQTKKENLLFFQTGEQIADLPYDEFEAYRRWLHEWLSRFR